MRTGINPLADAKLPPIPDVIAAVITHLPNRNGYHEDRFEVIKACLMSLDMPVYVWDNGSDPEFKDWLVKIRPEYLTLSPNIGKASARTAILRTFPPKTIICMSDDDILYSPGWLEAQLELLQGFPNVGAVSGCPIRTQARWGNASTLKWAKENATLTTGRFIPDEYEYDFCRSIGRDYKRHLQDSAKDMDYLVEFKGLKAYAMAHHMQFIGYAGRLSNITLWPNQAMRAEQGFDVMMDRMGLLRLTTTERYVQHIGNVLEMERV
jgi:hypothetical protein